MGDCRTSVTAETADSTSVNCATATDVGNFGVRRRVAAKGIQHLEVYRKDYRPSVTIPSVPSAPMKSLVVSNPADDFLALCLVLMTSPLGSTTVYIFYEFLHLNAKHKPTYRIKEPFSLRSTVSHGIR